MFGLRNLDSPLLREARWQAKIPPKIGVLQCLGGGAVETGEDQQIFKKVDSDRWRVRERERKRDIDRQTDGQTARQADRSIDR